MLLAGRAADVVGEDAELFHDRTGNGGALRILLRLLDRSWCAVQGTLVEPLSHDVLESLSVGQADHLALHRLLGECLDKPVTWSGLCDEEALQLLQDLYGATHEEQERWRAMPLHRGVDEVRGAFNQRARRSTGKTDEWRLPPELEAEVRLLDPEPRVAHLYDSVPDMDRNGLLRLMLEDSRPWRFAERVVQSVRPSEGQVHLPQDGELRDLLRRSRWLPQRDGGALAPDAVLIAPEELLDAAAGLAATGAFGDNAASRRRRSRGYGKRRSRWFERSSGARVANASFSGWSTRLGTDRDREGRPWRVACHAESRTRRRFPDRGCPANDPRRQAIPAGSWCMWPPALSGTATAGCRHMIPRNRL